MEAIGRVPRHEFVPVELRGFAYVNSPLPIGCGKTISQPYINALMTDLLDVGPEHTVLEVGTGLGYQAALLAELAARVCSVEIIAELASAARARLEALGYGNIELRHGDGSRGWAEHGPFDRILVAAAARPGAAAAALPAQAGRADGGAGRDRGRPGAHGGSTRAPRAGCRCARCWASASRRSMSTRTRRICERSGHHLAAVDRDHLAGDVARRRGEQPDDGLRHLPGPAEPADRDDFGALRHRGVELVRGHRAAP